MWPFERKVSAFFLFSNLHLVVRIIYNNILMLFNEIVPILFCMYYTSSTRCALYVTLEIIFCILFAIECACCIINQVLIYLFLLFIVS